jgi:hypothetical protein
MSPPHERHRHNPRMHHRPRLHRLLQLRPRAAPPRHGSESCPPRNRRFHAFTMTSPPPARSPLRLHADAIRRHGASPASNSPTRQYAGTYLTAKDKNAASPNGAPAQLPPDGRDVRPSPKTSRRHRRRLRQLRALAKRAGFEKSRSTRPRLARHNSSPPTSTAEPTNTAAPSKTGPASPAKCSPPSAKPSAPPSRSNSA